MELTIGYNGISYFIQNRHNSYISSLDSYIASKLDITTLEYRNIQRKFNGYAPDSFYGEIFFKNEEDAKKCLIALEPYIIIAKLTE